MTIIVTSGVLLITEKTIAASEHLHRWEESISDEVTNVLQIDMLK